MLRSPDGIVHYLGEIAGAQIDGWFAAHVGGDPSGGRRDFDISTIAWPSLWRSFASGAVGPYSLTHDAWRGILAAARENEVYDIKAALRQ